MMWDFDFIDEFKYNWNEKIKKWKTIYIVLSILMILAGIICLFFPSQIYDIIKIIAGIVMIGYGIYSLINYHMSISFFKNPFDVVYGMIHILFGILIMIMPSMLTAVTLTYILAFILLFYGAEKIAFAQRLKYFRIMDTKQYKFSGIVMIIVAIIFFFFALDCCFSN